MEVMEMEQRRASSARRRVPHRMGIVQLALRATGLAASFAFLAVIVYNTAIYSVSYPVAYIAVLWTVTVDIVEITALSSRTHSISRLSPSTIATLDTFSFIWSGPALAANVVLRQAALKEDESQLPPNPDEQRATAWFYVCVWVACGVLIIRIAIMAASCASCCGKKARQYLGTSLEAIV
ncbi:hypothetical protein EG329_014186 [Mollisiaceae sp. DMI_Dod_QoI]|nr:hypothetical protein EG329_014186 [Helotiales sp. DMI_Dod_QoI]